MKGWSFLEFQFLFFISLGYYHFFLQFFVFLSLIVSHLVEIQLWFSSFFILCKRILIFEFLKSKICFQNQNNPYLTLFNNGWVEGGKNQISSKRLEILLLFVVSKGKIANFFWFFETKVWGRAAISSYPNETN